MPLVKRERYDHVRKESESFVDDCGNKVEHQKTGAIR